MNILSDEVLVKLPYFEFIHMCPNHMEYDYHLAFGGSSWASKSHIWIVVHLHCTLISSNIFHVCVSYSKSEESMYKTQGCMNYIMDCYALNNLTTLRKQSAYVKLGDAIA
jgi:hypothetical protein